MRRLDTSGLLCYHHRDERQHTNAVTFFQTAPVQTAPVRLTHHYVLAEFVPLCQVRGLNRTDTLAFVTDLLDNPLVEVLWVDETLHRATLTLLQARLDKTYALCDAVSFVLLQHRGLTEALTADHHLEQEGFVRLLEP